MNFKKTDVEQMRIEMNKALGDIAKKYGASASLPGLHSGDSSAFSPHSSARFRFFSLRAAVVAERYSIHMEEQLVISNKVNIYIKIIIFFININ